jgi:hypothetical protein
MSLDLADKLSRRWRVIGLIACPPSVNLLYYPDYTFTDALPIIGRSLTLGLCSTSSRRVPTFIPLLHDRTYSMLSAYYLLVTVTNSSIAYGPCTLAGVQHRENPTFKFGTGNSVHVVVLCWVCLFLSNWPSRAWFFLAVGHDSLNIIISLKNRHVTLTFNMSRLLLVISYIFLF